MGRDKMLEITYFPGCSLDSTARESNQALIDYFHINRIRLLELEDWNCCGSSSAHSINSKLATSLAGRNFSLARPERPIAVACPSCYLRLNQAKIKLTKDPEAANDYRQSWGKPFDPSVQILHVLELIRFINESKNHKLISPKLNGIKCVPYYGCMLFRPPEMRHAPNFHGLMEEVLSKHGADVLSWPFQAQCCGSFLTVVRPGLTSAKVNAIFKAAAEAAAECIVTACAMCHMNLEIRCTIQPKIPVFHFSEVLALISGKFDTRSYFSRHLIDPTSVLKSRNLI